MIVIEIETIRALVGCVIEYIYYKYSYRIVWGFVSTCVSRIRLLEEF